MSYIYDILLNFNTNLFDFYDWNKNDNISHIKKIPLFKISNKKLKEIVNNNIVFDNEVLEKIKNKTEEYTNHKSKIIQYAFLLSDGLTVIGIKITKDNLYSKLLIDEEIDVLDVVARLKEATIKYNILSKKEKDFSKTRKETELMNNALKELNNIIKKNNNLELEYLYYDCFNERIDDIEVIKKTLYSRILTGDITLKVNEFIKLKKCIKHKI